MALKSKAKGKAATAPAAAVNQGVVLGPEDDDIYAIGVTLYELLTGKLPFLDSDQQTLIQKIRDPNVHAVPVEKILKENEIRHTIPEHICAVTMACLSKNPDHRPQKAKLIAADYC